MNFGTRTLDIRGGKGGKDGVGFFGAEAAQMLRMWIGLRPEAVLEDYLFVDRIGRSPHAAQRGTHSPSPLEKGWRGSKDRPSRVAALRSYFHPQTV